jgi:N-acetylglucosaminyldiphosphoundecaprenol N-acetyl-beta-D-mannosaminyltransferase
VGSRRVELFGVPVDALTMDESVARVRELVAEGGPHQHVVLNAAKVVEMDREPDLADIVRSCALVNADGASVVWASRLLGRRLPERVAGVDLFARLVAAAAEDGHAIYLLGAKREVVEQVAAIFAARHPGLPVAGVHDGFWDDDDDVIEHVRAARPHYLFLAIPSPRKEYWLRANLHRLDVPFVMGVGGSFDVVAGVTTRAPVFLQRIGMEWFWRFVQEPRRMWKRYLVGNAKFAALTWRAWRADRRADQRAERG